MRLHVDGQGHKDFEAGVWPDRKIGEMARLTGSRECRRSRGVRAVAAQLDGRAGALRHGKIHGDRWAIRGNEGADRGHLHDPREIARQKPSAGRSIPFTRRSTCGRSLRWKISRSIHRKRQAAGERKKINFVPRPPPAQPGSTRYMGLESGRRFGSRQIAGTRKPLRHGSVHGGRGEGGHVSDGRGLQPSSKSARVRYDGSKRIVIDGPFAETKELVAGYAILQYASKAEAIEWTKRFVQVDAPGRYGAECECELRPIFEFAEFGPSEAVERMRTLAAGAK